MCLKLKMSVIHQQGAEVVKRLATKAEGWRVLGSNPSCCTFVFPLTYSVPADPSLVSRLQSALRKSDAIRPMSITMADTMKARLVSNRQKCQQGREVIEINTAMAVHCWILFGKDAKLTLRRGQPLFRESFVCSMFRIEWPRRSNRLLPADWALCKESRSDSWDWVRNIYLFYFTRSKWKWVRLRLDKYSSIDHPPFQRAMDEICPFHSMLRNRG